MDMRHRRQLAATLVASLVLIAGCGGVADLNGDPIQTTAPGSIAPQSTDTPDRNSSSVSDVNSSLEVHFINVGQSVSTLIVGPTNETMLIDTGDFSNDGEYVLAYLRRHNIDRLDYLVVSHNDADHIGGNAKLIDY